MDAGSRQMEESRVRVNKSVEGLQANVEFDGEHEESSGRSGTVRDLKLGSAVVSAEDTLTSLARRRHRRARPAARRHARVRRRDWRCKTAACGLLAESRSTAAAAHVLSPGILRWRRALSTLRWRRMQAVWTQWMLMRQPSGNGQLEDAGECRTAGAATGEDAAGLGRRAEMPLPRHDVCGLWAVL